MAADLNVFQLTNMELHKTESKKTVKESVSKSKTASKNKAFKIPVSKLKLESLSHYLSEDAEETELDVTADYTPNDEVVLVIDPEMDEVPDDVEEAEDQAEDLIGDHICKCSICGANYVTDAEITEEMEMEEEECPVCGEVGEQIVVGVITPTEELSAEDEEEVEGTEDIDIEDEEEIETVDGDEEVEDEEFEEEDDFEESIKRSRARTLRRKAESVRKAPARKSMKKISESKDDVSFDEATFNRMLTRFAKENYSNVRFVRINKGTVRGKRLTLEGTVTTTKGTKKTIKFVAENFVPSKRMSIKFKESGAFTESVKNVGATFVVECVMRGSMIIPAALSYNFKAKNVGVKESRNIYSVTGKVLSESVRRPAPKKKFKK